MDTPARPYSSWITASLYSFYRSVSPSMGDRFHLVADGCITKDEAAYETFRTGGHRPGRVTGGSMNHAKCNGYGRFSHHRRFTVPARRNLEGRHWGALK